MQALILVGGFGSRLRPLTDDLPKPLLFFCGKPMVQWQIEALILAGVTEIILAIGYKEEIMMPFVNKMKKLFPINIYCSVEKTPLGTGGPLKLAKSFLQSNKSSEFFVLNSDIICDFPFKNMIKSHRKSKAEITILSYQTTEYLRYGVMDIDHSTGKIKKFVEKPEKFISDYINAGVYLISKNILDKIPLKNYSLERELFPLISSKGKAFVFSLSGFWKDLGVPADFVSGTALWLKYLSDKKEYIINDFLLVKDSPPFVGVNLVHQTVKYKENTKIGPYCVLNQNCEILDNCKLENTVIMPDVKLKQDTIITNKIIMQGEKNNLDLKSCNNSIFYYC